jgi:hypothetical protein
MNNKIIGLLLLVMLMASPALATIEVTVNTPLSGTIYNNLPSNVAPIDINYVVTDDNANVRDHNVTITIYDSNWTSFETVVSDVNVRNPPTGTSCGPSTGSLLDSYTCSTIWTMQSSATMPEDIYYIDVNAVSHDTNAQITVGDGNGFQQIQVRTTLATGDTLRSLMAVVGVVLAAIVLLGGLVAAIALKTDPAKTAILTVVAAIAVAIAAQIIGVVLTGV